MLRVLLIFILIALHANASAATLMGIYHLAQKNDHSYRSAIQSSNADSELDSIANAQLLPIIELAGQASQDTKNERYSGASDETNIQQDDKAYGIYITQSLFNLPLWFGVEESGALVKKSDADLQSAKLSVIARVARTCFEVSKRAAALELLRAEEDAYKTQLTYVEKLLSSGLTSIIDVHEARTAYDLSRIATIGAKSELSSAEESLSILTGSDLAFYPRLVPSARISRFAIAETKEDWIDATLAYSPTVISSRLAAEAARYSSLKVSAERYPTVLGKIGYSTADRNSETDYSSLSLNSDGFSAVVSVRIPIYEGGRVSATFRRASHKYLSAMEAAEQVKQEAVATTKILYEYLQSDIASLQLIDLTVAESKKGLDTTTSAYKIGARSMYDVIRAQRYYYQAQLTLFEKKHGIIMNYFQLKENSGTLSERDLMVADSLLSFSGRFSGIAVHSE